jgi:hypothetical protein
LRRVSLSRALLTALPFVGAWACTESSTDTLPLEDQRGVGSVEVTVVTMGSNLDSDGYIVAIDEDRSQAVEVNGVVEFNNLTPGTYEVSLTDEAPNCQVAPPNPQSVTVTRDIVTEALFSVACS